MSFLKTALRGLMAVMSVLEERAVKLLALKFLARFINHFAVRRGKNNIVLSFFLNE